MVHHIYCLDHDIGMHLTTNIFLQLLNFALNQQNLNNEKIPYYFTRKDSNFIFFAGIYEEDQFCLITEEAKQNISEIHHRQPVIINQKDVNRYLNLELQGSVFLKESSKPDLIFHMVSKDVNNPINNSPSLVQTV